MIRYEPIEVPSCSRVVVDGVRYYQTPAGDLYPSVTTVLSHGEDKTFLKKWRARVGEEEANRITKRATERGTRLHSFCEDYIKGKPVKPGPFDLETWNVFKPVLNNIERVTALETPLFSNKLRVAGTVDCIGVYDGVPSIIDFKTSKRTKTKEDIPSYFMQTAAYACAWLELTGEKITQGVILMSVDDENPIVFKEPLQPWLLEFAKLRNRFDKDQKKV